MIDEVAQSRNALYYPYIAIPEVNWLKATLLSFPQVSMMLPSPEQMSQEQEELCDTQGPRGPLLSFLERPDWELPEVEVAQRTLLRKIQDNEQVMLQRYSLEATVRDGRYDEAGTYWIHVTKPGKHLLPYLEKVHLAWRYPPTRLSVGGHEYVLQPFGLNTEDWVCMHPKLGEAILSTVAVAIAPELGVDIVTDLRSVHHTVVYNDPEYIFDDLLGLPKRNVSPDSQLAADQLAHAVIMTTFDVSRFKASDIAGLLHDGNDLRRFKGAVKRMAAGMPNALDSAAREKFLKEAAGQIVEEWKKFRKSLPRIVADAFVDAGNLKFPEFASSVLGFAGANAMHLAAAEGLTLAVLTCGGMKVYRTYQQAAKNDFQYLSRIQDRVNSLALPLMPSDVLS